MLHIFTRVLKCSFELEPITMLKKVASVCVCTFRLYFQFPFIMSSVKRRLVTNNLDRFPEISDHNWSYMAFSV